MFSPKFEKMFSPDCTLKKIKEFHAGLLFCIILFMESTYTPLYGSLSGIKL